MKACYSDLLALSSDYPSWFDEFAVPRFCPFEPDMIANIYAKECCLYLIECQACKHEFKVAASWHVLDGFPLLSEQINTNNLHFGDPPNIGCCDAGPSMTSVTVRILEFWVKNQDTEYKWVRNAKLEKEIEDLF